MPSKGRNKSKGRRRTKVISKGLRSHSKHPLTPVQRALLGKGVVQAMKPVGAVDPSGSARPVSRWSGQHLPSNPPWDAEQVELNKELYPHLFMEA